MPIGVRMDPGQPLTEHARQGHSDLHKVRRIRYQISGLVCQNAHDADRALALCDGAQPSNNIGQDEPEARKAVQVCHSNQCSFRKGTEPGVRFAD